jgi:hypothetical protein
MEFDCHYPNSGAVTVPQGYLQTLESRLAAMERRLPLSPANRTLLSVAAPLSTPFPTQTTSVITDIDVPVTIHDEMSPQVTDAMGSLGFVNEEQTSFYGSTNPL